MNKQEVAHEIKTQLDLLYAQVTNNQKNAMSYQDICKITDYLSDVFLKQTGEVPKLISGACDVARGLLNPNKISSMNELRKGFGLLLTTIGGLGLIWGIMVAIGVGVSVWTSIIAFFTGGSFPFLGPLAIAAGLAAIVTGVYVAMTFLSPTDLSARAHDIVVKAIDAWADPKAAAEADKQAVKHMESETK
jgi:uncharacterized membrane protein